MRDIARRLLVPGTLLAILALIGLLGAIQAGPVSPVERATVQNGAFPAVVGVNLNGERIALPDAFEGERNLVVLAFTYKDHRAARSWRAVATRRVGLEVYALPTLERGGLVFRFLVNNALRFAIVDEAARARTIALHLDKAALQDVLDLPAENGVTVLLLDGAGRELWRTSGPASEESIAALDRALVNGG